MNIFLFIGDFLHLLSFVVIIYKLWNTKSCSGVSAKTQELYLFVFVLRYLDLFETHSRYLFLMKIVFISTTCLILFLMHLHPTISTSYDRTNEDDMPHFQYLLPLCAILTLLIKTGWTKEELLWSYSQWLEAMAIVPQIFILHKMQGVEKFTAHYIASLGLYRMFYILNWYRTK